MSLPGIPRDVFPRSNQASWPDAHAIETAHTTTWLFPSFVIRSPTRPFLFCRRDFDNSVQPPFSEDGRNIISADAEPRESVFIQKGLEPKNTQEGWCVRRARDYCIAINLCLLTIQLTSKPGHRLVHSSSRQPHHGPRGNYRP
jgi:hypothetical protein